MIDDKLIEIGYLAESLAEENFFDNKVDLIRIAESQSITVISGNYEDYFLGELVCDGGDFFIHLNYDKLPSEDSPRMRFTLGHELGHYFIDDHRAVLKNGISLHKSTTDGGNNLAIEKEANFFASNLLMPQNRFVSLSRQFEPGIDSILKIKNQFHSSIESTVIRYTQLDILPCIIIKWHEDVTPKFISYSRSFSILTGVKGRPNIKVNIESIKKQFELLGTIDIETDYIEENVLLSKWLPAVIPRSRKDFNCLEQTLKLGQYGGITVVYLR